MNDNDKDRWEFIARHTRLDNLITHLLRSDEGRRLAERLDREEDEGQ